MFAHLQHWNYEIVELISIAHLQEWNYVIVELVSVCPSKALELRIGGVFLHLPVLQIVNSGID